MTELKSDIEGSANQLKKSIGKTVITLNSDILELHQIYKKFRSSTPKDLSEKEIALETKVKKSYNGLKEAVVKLESRPEYINSEGLDKLLKLMTTTIESAETLFGSNNGFENVSEDKIKQTQELAKKSVNELVEEERAVVKTFEDLSKTLSSLHADPEISDTAESELAYLSRHKQERYRKIEKMLKNHMEEQTKKLEKAWEEERDSLDYTALKELRFEFDQADKQVRHAINEWERRKYSDFLADHLVDIHEQLFQIYHDKYSKMADE